MANFQKKKDNNRKLIQSKPVLVFLIILTVFLIYNVIGLFIKREETEKNKEIAQNKIIELQKQKEKLTSDIEKLNTEKGLEESIRDKFGLAKDGENMIVIVDDASASIPSTENGKKGFFSFFKKIFK